MVEFDIKVENVVAFAILHAKIQLNDLVSKLEDTEYDPERFPGVVYRIKEPRTAILIFSSGKLVCTGARSIAEAKKAVDNVAKMLRKLGVKVPKKYECHIENIVASTRIKADLNLEDIVMMLENTEYEPEQFPGLVYRIKEPRVAFLLFRSGKIICTGARNLDDIHTALEKFRKNLIGIGIKVTPVKNDGSKVKPVKAGKSKK